MSEEFDIDALRDKEREENKKNYHLSEESEYIENQRPFPNFKGIIGVAMLIAAIVASLSTLGILSTKNSLFITGTPILAMVTLYIFSYPLVSILKRCFVLDSRHRDSSSLDTLGTKNDSNNESLAFLDTDYDSPQLREWHKFYQECLDITLDDSMPIVTKIKDLNQLLIIEKTMKPSLIIKKMKEKGIEVFTFRDLTHLDKCTNERDPQNGTYAIWVRDRQEADEELKNKSANQIKKENLKTETLTERLIHGFYYYWKHKKHLDEKNYTLCAASRYSDGYVPCVDWSPRYGGVEVSWNVAVYANGCMCARAVVS